LVFFLKFNILNAEIPRKKGVVGLFFPNLELLLGELVKKRRKIRRRVQASVNVEEIVASRHL
jgi:hypothetical protein